MSLNTYWRTEGSGVTVSDKFVHGLVVGIVVVITILISFVSGYEQGNRDARHGVNRLIVIGGAK